MVNNAGGMRRGDAPEFVKSPQGRFVESTVWSNHVGVAALTWSLIPCLESSAGGGRVVTVASRLEKRGTVAGLVMEGSQESGANGGSSDGSESRFGAYATSKQANILFAKELAERHSTIMSVAVTPGMVNTALGRWHSLFTLSAPLRWILLPTPDQGAKVVVEAATTDAGALQNGGYYGLTKIKPGKLERLTPSPSAEDASLAKKLWAWTRETTRGSGPPESY